ncbi:MAG: DUF3999 family protein [Candidatus Rokubacteria bacterium]|nr:DUF3999 family protein [Candidatus Rokubacteria bacterium]
MTPARALAIAVALLGLCVDAGATSPPELPAAWTFRKPIMVPPDVGRGFVETTLDGDVYARALPTLADLRVRDDAGREVGYAIRRHEQPTRTTERDRPLLDLTTTGAHDTRFSIDLGADPGRHNRVRVTIAGAPKTFVVPVRIETSADGRRWATARAAGSIYAVEADRPATDTSVSYPMSTARWVRVTLGAAAGRALSVTAASVVTETPAERDDDVMAARLIERVEAPSKRTVLMLDVDAPRPIDQVEIDVEDRNFHRVVGVEGSLDRRQWRWAGSAAISAFETPALRERTSRVHVAEVRARWLKVTIHNLDSQPLRVAGVRVRGVRRSLVFEAAPDRRYVLEYGHPTAPAPRYDVPRLSARLASERLPRATLGAAVAIPPAPPTPPSRWLDAQPILLWGSMAVAVLILGLVLARLARQIRTNPSAGGESTSPPP